MPASDADHPSFDKRSLRRVLADRRAKLDNRAGRSARALGRLDELGVRDPARRVLWYLNIRSEVETEPAVRQLVGMGRDVVVPYCVGSDLHLWSLRDFDELAPARWGILEPRLELRGREERRVDPGELDLIVVPGLGFTERGDRLGYGAGYYDRLLASTEAQRVGLCFETQVVAQLPTEHHDARMHAVVTEERTLLLD